MKVIAAYLLAQLGGNTNPSADDLRKILNSVGAEIDESKIELLLSQVKGKDITELIAAGKQQLASTSMAFGCGAASSVVNGAENNVAEVAVEEKKEEKKVEVKEESDEEDFNFSLFD
ncbi:PREDICTED: 60S acidic ribosomal protein P2B-like isoform X1 [Nicotiana attenuata]|uniref:60s acidic ribosomal protein p2 n=1 Tax=Nicotiana attenuata TaxID=49451 RepID=A0A1J6HXL0_NICAT|nr:PREDICTED: 60S acidic ribosomal protein P2B-like isoform X1 [Nicotiana attenuata]OIS97097.1 60s acidic ribosomal protein p2 [Nicotiana attenuata]